MKGKKASQERPSIIDDNDSNDNGAIINDNSGRDIDPSTGRTSRITRPNGRSGNNSGNNSGNGSSIIVPDNGSDSSGGTTSENIIGGTNN